MDHVIEEREINGHRVRVLYDTDPMNPRTDFENVGVMVCWHRRYKLGDVDPAVNPQDWEAPRGAIVLPIYAYEHSGITIRTGAFSCPWDSGQVGWIYATREKMAAALGVKHFRPSRHMEQAQAILKGEVETFDQFLTGQVFGYVIDKAETCDKGHTHYETIDSCWGFFGSANDTMQEAIACVPECKG